MDTPSSETETAKAGSNQLVSNRASLLRCLAILRAVLAVLTAAYVVAFFSMLAGLEWVGERFWPFGIFLYAPPQIFLVPLLALTPLCLLLRWRLCLWHLACTAFLFFVYQPYRLGSKPAAVPGEIAAVTFNQGQSNEAQLLDFVAQVKPDLILLQDVQWSVPQCQAKFPGFDVASRGEFMLVSRFPIEQAAFVMEPRDQGRWIAARFEVRVNGQPLAIYSVHLMTPRQQLSRFLGGSVVFRHYVATNRGRTDARDYRTWLRARCEVARQLAGVFAAEKLPYIVGGDFNTPDHGHIYQQFAGMMTDAFAASGRGWGLTFPANARHPIVLFGPWLRLDYFFAGRGWRALECWPESGRKSQHRAVFARLAPVAS